jgi:hypothetical protein
MKYQLFPGGVTNYMRLSSLQYQPECVMNSNHHLHRSGLKLFLLAVLLPVGVIAQNIIIAGRVVVIEIWAPLPYSTISNFDKGSVNATNANNEGSFSIQLPVTPDSVKVSMIGYRSEKLNGAANFGPGHITIALQRAEKLLEEVVIKPLNALDIIRQAIARLPSSQPTKSFQTTGFYREIIRDREHYFSVAEAVFTTQFDPRKKDYTLRLDKGRAKEDVSYTQLFEDYHPGGGPQEAMKNSFLVEIPAFLNNKELGKFEFKRLPGSVYDGEQLYVIGFDQKADIKQALEMGTIFINAEDFSIVRYEASTSPRGLSFIRGLTGSDKMFADLLGIEFQHKGWKRKATFIKVENLSFLNYAESEHQISYKQKRKQLDLDLVLSLQLLLSPQQDTLKQKITKEEEWKKKDLVRNLPVTFDPAYWGMSETISPTKELTEIVNGISSANKRPLAFGALSGWNKYNEPLFVTYPTGDSIIFVPTARSHWEDNHTGPFLYRNLDQEEAIEALVKISKNSDPTAPPDNGFQQSGIMIRDSSAGSEHHLALTIGTSGGKKLKLILSETRDGKKISETYNLQDPVAWLKIERKGSDVIVSKKLPAEGLWQVIKTYSANWSNPRLQAGLCSSVRFPGDAPKMRPDIRAVYSNIKIGPR